MSIVVTIEGNIGSGKSTLCKELETISFNKPHKVIYENVEEWCKFTDENGRNIFELYYMDKQKYSYLFQSYVVCSRVSHILDTIKKYPDHIIICERSHLTDYYIFATVLHTLDLMSDLEYKIYTEVFKTLNLDITATIYNKVDSNICISRIKKRNRQGEQITPDYIQILHDAHEAWLSSKNDNTDINVLTIDGNVDNLDIEKRQQQIEDIISFVNSKI